MADSQNKDVWATGAAYEPYVGRWSRLVAQEFLSWLNIPARSSWLDVGCGTGALSETILKFASPRAVKGIDRSGGYIQFARKQIADERVRFEVDDAQALSDSTATYDAAVSGLVLNFVPAPGRAVSEMARVVNAGGIVAVYVWDYADQMQLMRYFWDAAVVLDPAAQDLDEGRRFPLCKPQPLMDVFKSAGLQNMEARAIDVLTRFVDFDDYWKPFLGGQGPAPGYVMSLTEERRSALRERIRSRLPIAADGSIPLIARAWAIRGEARHNG